MCNMHAGIDRGVEGIQLGQSVGKLSERQAIAVSAYIFFFNSISRAASAP